MIQVRDGNFGSDLEGLDPTITWKGSATTCDFDFEYGTEASLQVTDDLASLPRNVWGKMSRKFGQWGVSAHAKVNADAMKNANIELTAGSKNSDASAKVMGSAGRDGISLSNVEVTKGFDINGTHYIAFTPRFNVASRECDVLVKFDKDKTNIDVVASRTSQTICISRQIDENNRIAPTFTSDGAFSLAWERKLGKGNSVTTTLTPDEAIDVQWKDGEWKANIMMPLDGTNISGANVSIKKELKL